MQRHGSALFLIATIESDNISVSVLLVNIVISQALGPCSASGFLQCESEEPVLLTIVTILA